MSPDHATRQDHNTTRSLLRADLEATRAALRGDMATEFAAVRSEMAQQLRITVGAQLASTLVLLGLLIRLT